METSQFRATTAPSLQCASERSPNRGFSILEVLFAVTILAVGLSAMAALIARSLTGTESARFMALATTLASEKLEDLNRYPNATPPVTQLTAGGSLTADFTGYNDTVDLSNTQGQISESIPTSTGYSNIIHLSTGEVQVNPTATSAPAGGSGTVVFHRRWLIEQDPTVNGVTVTGSRRVTVVVTMANQIPPVSFQMSMVRP
jgi:prepilin-type N-terminal cleavage/methylation domain-containing protein